MAEKVCPELEKRHWDVHNIGILVVEGETFVTDKERVDLCLNCPYEQCVYSLWQK